MDPRYPIGKFELPKDVTPALRQAAIVDIAATPAKVRAAVAGLSDAQLDTPYREGGWTVRQVVHHIADSHMNAYVRCRLALTETQPTMKPYEQEAWANLEDARSAPVEVSLKLIEPLHERWVRLLRSVKAEDYARTLLHPDTRQKSGLAVVHLLLAREHHTAHITRLREQKGW